jgi:SAM-dependent methyltransferase
LELSIGCGDKPCDIGIDIRKTKFTTVQASCDYLPFGSGIFDKVSARMLLEHLGNPVVALKEAKRVLKVGEKLFAVVPNDSLGRIYQVKCFLLLRFKAAWQFTKGIQSGEHKWQFSIYGSKLLLWQLGFRNIEVYVKRIFPYLDGDIIMEASA